MSSSIVHVSVTDFCGAGTVQRTYVVTKKPLPASTPPLSTLLFPTMLGSSFLPARFRLGSNQSASAPPSYLNRRISPLLEALSRRSCTHPIHTIVFVLLLASTSYLGLLEGSLFDSDVANGASGSIDLPSLVDGGRQLKLSSHTNWKWQVDSRGISDLDEVRNLHCNSTCLLISR